MNLTTAINAAVSGLNATTRMANTVSSNVANALTEGYARRELQLVSRDAGLGAPGVRVVAERRVVDQGLLAERRQADAAAGEAGARSAALVDLDRAFGVPGDPGSLTGRIAELDAALAEAASRPDSELRLARVVQGAEDLARSIGSIAGQVQDARAEADRQIDAGVRRLNDGLAQIADINRAILRERSSGQPPNGLFDARQRLIDDLSDLVALRVVDRPNDQIAIYTDTGAILLDGQPAEIGFVPAGGPVVPGMSLGAGLAGLAVNGQPVSTGPMGALGGGALAGYFAMRDAILPRFQDGLDALATDLVQRFGAADAAGPAPAGSGLFVDTGGGGAEGRAQRLGVNPLLDGAVWRLRDGLGAAGPGAPGQSSALLAMIGALATPAALPPPGMAGHARDFAGHAAVLQSEVGQALVFAEGALGFAAARGTALSDAMARQGVDTDDEMQKLLLIERAYAANARVIRAADEMLQTLLAI